jgi:hypothetical protein
MLMVLFASEFEVVKLVASTICEWNPVMDLQPVGSTADHAGPIALVNEGSESSPFPAALDLAPGFPAALLVALARTVWAWAWCAP